jgi:N-acetylmuramoyl-L-alanine amidase
MVKPAAARIRMRRCFALVIAACILFAPLLTRNGAAFANCIPSQFAIAVDVGHTADVTGAMSARGKPEYEFNLTLAKEIVSRLTKAGFAKTTLMISSEHGRQGLIQRSAQANTMGVNLFLSIHHDSVQGVYLRKWTFEGRSLSFSDRYQGYSLFVSGENAHFAQSLQFAATFGDALLARGLVFTTHHAENIKGERRKLIDSKRGVYRFDQLVVLRQSQAPALLLEAGIIINREEETQLASPERQRLISEAAADAVTSFCNAPHIQHSE